MSRRLLAALLAFLPSFALADTVPIQGVWKGTVGTKAVIACFNDSYYGSFYDVDTLKPIPLTMRRTDNAWHERDTAAIWELVAPANGTLAGTRRDPKTGTSLPIKLSFVDGNGDTSACARDSFNLPLEHALKVETGETVGFSPDRSYRKLRFAAEETVELFGPDPALERLNTLLKLDQSQKAVDTFFQQRRDSLGRNGSPDVDERHTEPVYWDDNFITLKFYRRAAGTGHSELSTTYRTWNAKTGEVVDLWRWIGTSVHNPYVPPQLKSFLYKDVTETPDCRYGYRGMGEFTLIPDKTGLHFDEESLNDGCEHSFFVPYEKLIPFLSPDGKEAVNAILGRE